MPDPLVLVVEDDPADVMLLERAFRRLDTPVTLRTVRDGAQAIAWLGGTGVYAVRDVYPMPSVLLLDLHTPGLSGFDVLAWVRSRPGLRRLPVVVLSTSGEPLDVERAYDLGASAYMVKPSTAAELDDLVDSFTRYWLGVNQGASVSPYR